MRSDLRRFAAFATDLRSFGKRRGASGGGGAAAPDLSVATRVGVVKSIGAVSPNARGMVLSADGLHMYLTDFSNDLIYQYNLSTAWDVSTATYASKSLDPANGWWDPIACHFSEDGLSVYTAIESNETVTRYQLSTAWDLATATFSQSKGTGGDPNYTWLAESGATLFVLRQNATLEKYTMSTPYDLSTASLAQSKILTGNKGLFFWDDGTKFWTASGNAAWDSKLHTYEMSTPWDLSTAAIVPAEELDLADPPSGIREAGQIAITPDATKFYVVDRFDQDITEYSLAA